MAAEPVGLDDGRAEAVVALPDHVAGADADPDLDRRGCPPVQAGQSLLHRLGGGHRLDRGAEDHHEAVTGALDLAAAVLGEGVAEHPVVRTAELVGGVVPDPLAQRRRRHDVGEEDGGGLRTACSPVGHGVIVGLGATVRSVSPPDDIEAAIAEVVDGAAVVAMFHSSIDARLWVQASRVEGEDLLLCEAVSDEFVGRHDQLAPGTLERLSALGWGESPADYTRWEAAATPEDRAALADVLWRTLVEAFGHEPERGPDIDLLDEG